MSRALQRDPAIVYLSMWPSKPTWSIQRLEQRRRRMNFGLHGVQRDEPSLDVLFHKPMKVRNQDQQTKEYPHPFNDRVDVVDRRKASAGHWAGNQGDSFNLLVVILSIPKASSCGYTALVRPVQSVCSVKCSYEIRLDIRIPLSTVYSSGYQAR